jgi:hypothetical protein
MKLIRNELVAFKRIVFIKIPIITLKTPKTRYFAKVWIKKFLYALFRLTVCGFLPAELRLDSLLESKLSGAFLWEPQQLSLSRLL